MPGKLPESKPGASVTPGSGAADPDATTAATGDGSWRRALVIGVVMLVVLTVAVGGVEYYLRSVDMGIPRVDAFTGVPDAARPPKVVVEAMNLLILGSDTVILAHFPKGRASAQFISIPRDTWIHIPKSRDGGGSGQDGRIADAYAWGGIPLAVQTVEGYTGVRIDHVVIIDFTGFQQMVDALGGVDIEVDQTVTSASPPYRTFTQGRQHMDGATAVDYSRQGGPVADAGFTRIRHQQQVIRGVLDKTASRGLLSNPVRFNSFLRASAKALSVDKTLSIVELASNLRHLRGGPTFLISPSASTGDVVLPDSEKAKVLYAAVQSDDVAGILSAAAR
ncbi:MAG: LCP family protein [Micromonosporaceae bacterium]|nr:LCP family protein [Micromonosporaceae bacterium]